MVEGDAEFAALPLLHGKVLIPSCPPLKATNLGGIGSHCTPIAIAKMAIGRVIAHQVAGRTMVVLCIDREQRDVCVGEFATDVLAALHSELRARGRLVEDVHVVVADRAFEAWILADARGLHRRRARANAPSFHCFEGSLGERQTKGEDDLSKLLGRPYSETSDGPRLFAKIDFTAARSFRVGGHGSRSLDKFLRMLGV